MFDDPFQAGIITFFIIAAVAGVAVFAISPDLLGGGGDGQRAVTMRVWGTIDSSDFNNVLESAGITEDESLTVNYTAVDNGNFRTRLVNALAQNEGPDALLVPHTQLLQVNEFLTTVGPQTYNMRTFRDNFVEGTEIFTTSEGVVGLPFAMDPLVMYWNRDMLSSAGFVSPPETWGQMSRYIDGITAVDDAQNINRSAVALGTARNITHSKQILSALLLQAGSPIVARSDSTYRSTLASSQGGSQPANAAVRLYTQYANPAAATYTWNNNLPADTQAFTGNQVAMYFDTGQAITDIRERNPNLNFDVARIPQRSDGQTRTYAKMYGLALLERVAPRRRGLVFNGLQQLTTSDVSESLLENTSLTPVHKQVVAQASPDEAYKSTLLGAAVTARAWPDPNPQRTDQIFSDLITNVTSGRNSVSRAVDNASRSLDALLSQ